MIFQILGFLASPFGWLTFILGIVLFFILPLVPRTLGIFHGLADFHMKLGARMLKRAAVVVSEQGDLLLKRMRPNDVGTEEIVFQSDTKEFEDPHEAKSNWMGIPFAFADETHGIFFSLRDCALGKREKQANEQDELVIKATEQEQNMYEVMGWQKALYELPKGVYELVNLNHVRHLITGSERGEHPQRVKAYYENSRKPYQDGTGVSKWIMLIVAMLAPFGMCFFIWQQMSTGGGGGGGTKIIGFMALGLLGSDGIAEVIKTKANAFADRIKAVDWKYVADRTAAWTIHTTKVLLVVAPLPILFAGIAYYLTLTMAIVMFSVLAMGFLFIPFMIEILKKSDGVTGSLSEILIKLGLSAYSSPVWVETPEGYRIREYSHLDVDEDTTTWHTLLGRYSGFSFDPNPSMWGTEVADKERVKSMTLGADGGSGDSDPLKVDGGEQKSAAKTNLPSGYSIIPEKQRAVYGSFVPSRIRDGKYYLWTGIALSRYKNVATGEKTFKRLEKSKEEFGESDGIEDSSMLKAIMGTGVFSLIMGILVFFVLL